ncbi:MAG: proteasome activator, partial [Pseudonocardiaceae bacterium]
MSKPDEQHIVVVGPDGQPVHAMAVPPGMSLGAGSDEQGGSDVADMVEQPAKVMRIGTMIKQLLEEVRAAPLDEASRARLK